MENNKTIFMLLLLTISVSLLGTFFTLNKLSSIGTSQITGMATSDTGAARIQIEDLLAIDIDDNNNTIDFGNCTPTSIVNTNVSISSYMTEAEVNATAMKCKASNIPAGIVVLNTGNINANVTVYYSVNGTVLLGSTRGELYYKSADAASNGGCTAGFIQTDWTEVTLTGPSNKYNVCENMTSGEFSNRATFWVNLTVPNDARTTVTNTSRLTFEAAVV